MFPQLTLGPHRDHEERNRPISMRTIVSPPPDMVLPDGTQCIAMRSLYRAIGVRRQTIHEWMAKGLCPQPRRWAGRLLWPIGCLGQFPRPKRRTKPVESGT